MTRLCPFLIVIAVAAGCGCLSASGADWPQWQGPDRDAVSRETGLLQQWPEAGPPLAWKGTGLGKGMGGIAVSGGRIYTTGDDAGNTAWLYAFDESDGQPAWSAKIGPGGNPGNVFKPFGPRATPTVDGDRLYILSQTGDLVCFTTEGQEIWRVNYIEDFGGIMPVWGFSESPLVDGERLICTPGGADAVLMALDKRTGKYKVPEGKTGDRGFLGTSGAAYALAIAVDVEGGVSTCSSRRRRSSGSRHPTASCSGATTAPPTRTASTAPPRGITTALCTPLPVMMLALAQ